MKRRTILLLTVVLTVLATLVLSTPGFSQPPRPGIEQLGQDAGGEVEITWNAESGNLSFIRGHIPLQPAMLEQGMEPATVAMAFVGRYAEAFGIKDPSNELKVAWSEMDALGMSHVTLRQVYQGVEVYGAQMKVHLSADGQEVVALSNGFVPGIALPAVSPQVSADQALATARMALPNGELVSSPKLVVYPGTGSHLSGASAYLAWLVELWDDSVPARDVYVVDANTGMVLDVLSRLYIQDPPQSDRLGAASNPQVEHDPEYVLVRLRPGVQASQIFAEAHEAIGNNWVKVRVREGETPTQALARLVENPSVEKVELNYVIRLEPQTGVLLEEASGSDISVSWTPNDPYYSYQWHFPPIEVPQAWDTTSGSGVTVAIIDTGISQGGSDLDCHTFVDEYNAITSATGSGAAEDDNGHGTHVAGTVAQCTNNGVGVAGIAFQATLMPVKVLNSSGSGTTADIAQGIDWARTHGADVINMSLGMSCTSGWPACSSDVMNDAIAAAAAADIVIVAAAGNDNQSVVGFPANHPNVIAVGALDYNLQRAPYSNYGSALSVTAPGGNTSADANGDGYADGVLQETFDYTGWAYYFFQGTSMASPHVAGATALLRAYAPGASRAQVQQALESTAQDLGASGFDTVYGYGAIQIDAALTAITSAPPPTPTHTPTPTPSLTPSPSPTPGPTTEPERRTYTANNSYNLPGTLVRSEGDGPTGDQDVDNAHDFAGDTYNYYRDTHGRDSYDDQGATIISTAHYGSNYMNAFWNGSQMVYGDGFAVKDVVAHELTHAVTEHTANLEYSWQSGALNESFSDIFGAMVDRDDWLMGEDLPSAALAGRDAMRDLSNPSRLGQPGHTDDWVSTCTDNEGVHTNSGIPNKAYYNIATATGKDKAERIFYRALVTYLQPTSSLEDARAAALQAAQDLYGSGSAEYNAVQTGFNTAGLDGVWNPDPNDCTCAASTALTDEEVYPDRASALQVATTLYRVRDQLLSTTPAGQHYRTLYEQYTGRITALLLGDAQLRATGGQILRGVTPGLTQLMAGDGDQAVVTGEMVVAVVQYLYGLIAEAQASGDEELAQTIEQEMARIDWNYLVGMTFDEAWAYINSQTSGRPYKVYLPLILR